MEQDWATWRGISARTSGRSISKVDYAFQIRDGNANDSGFEQQFHGREQGENPPELVIRFKPAGR